MTFQRNLSISTLAKNKLLRYFILALVVIVVVFGVKKALDSKAPQSSSSVLSTTGASDAKASMTVDREFTFPLAKDADGKTTQEFKFYLDRAELRDEIVIKGQKATAVKGRDFLILALKITNQHNQTFKIKSKDYVRLSTDGGTKEWLAPSINNDPVEVQAISTQPTRVGFYVNEGLRDFVLQVGEIDGNKEIINISLR